MSDIYCYYHRHVRMEITQRYGQTYAVCPECRLNLSNLLHYDICQSQCGRHLASDDLLLKLETKATSTTKPIKWPAITY